MILFQNENLFFILLKEGIFFYLLVCQFSDWRKERSRQGARRLKNLKIPKGLGRTCVIFKIFYFIIHSFHGDTGAI